MPRIPTRSMFKGGVRVQVRSSSTACQHWYVGWHGNSMYGLHQRKMSERFMQIFSSSFTFTRKSKSCSTATDIVTIGMCCIKVNIFCETQCSFVYLLTITCLCIELDNKWWLVLKSRCLWLIPIVAAQGHAKYLVVVSEFQFIPES